MIWLRSPAPERVPSVPTATALPAPCQESLFGGQTYVVCILPPTRYAISIVHNDGQADPTATVMDAVRARTAAGRPPVLAMNAGMYDPELNAIGLLIEGGVTLSRLNRNDGPGNFHLKPNGVFAVDRAGRARVVDAARWKTAPDTAFATQSGPLLVIDGALHPAFSADGASRYRRNGVGVQADGTVVVAISRDRVSFGAFARLFQEALDCPNALFLDGAVSTLAGPSAPIVGGAAPAGPVLMVDAKDS